MFGGSSCTHTTHCPCRGSSVPAARSLLLLLQLLLGGCWEQWKPPCLLERGKFLSFPVCPSRWETEGAPCHRTMTQTSSQSSQMGPKESRELHKLSLGVSTLFRSQMTSRLKLTSLLSFPPASFVSARVSSVDVGLGISTLSLASVGCYLENCRIHSPGNWDFW